MAPYTISVEGNIGCGKSTMLKYFESFLNIDVIPEPVEVWKNFNGYNLLDAFYKNREADILPFQSLTLLTGVNSLLRNVGRPIKIIERSVYSSRYCFMELMKRQGILNESAFSLLDGSFKIITDWLPLRVDHIVYIRTDPEVSYRRLQERNRTEETSISLDYLRGLHNLHEEWLLDHDRDYTEVTVIDGNLGIENIVSEYRKISDLLGC